MTELITTVRERYRRINSFRGLSTLVYRGNTAASTADTAENRRQGLLLQFHPQLQSVSKKLHDEISTLIDRRDKLILQTITRDMTKTIGQYTAQIKTDSQRTGKAFTARTERMEKRVELITADTGARLKEIQKELARLRAAETTRAREEARMAYEQPIIDRSTQQRIRRETENEREELRREIGVDIERTERRITRRLRDEEEYEKRRRG